MCRRRDDCIAKRWKGKGEINLNLDDGYSQIDFLNGDGLDARDQSRQFASVISLNTPFLPDD